MSGSGVGVEGLLLVSGHYVPYKCTDTKHTDDNAQSDEDASLLVGASVYHDTQTEHLAFHLLC